MTLRGGRGFTMVELLVVIALLTILGGISSGVFISFKEDAKRAQTTKNMLAIKTIVRGNSELNGSGQFTQPGYLNDMGRYPASLDELVTQGAQTTFNPFNKRGWRGNYVATNASTWSQDAWGSNYSYDASARTIRSCGVDKSCGNSDDVVVYLTAEGSSTSASSASSGGSSSASSASAPTPVDGGWTSWGTWADTSSCTGTCGTGSKTQIRWRTCTQPVPAYGGAPCAGFDNDLQTISCALSACPIDGGWTSWSAWANTSSCTVTCGGGTINQQQTRTCTNPTPQYGGASCSGASSATQTIACNTFPCAINGGWSTASNLTTSGVSTYDNRYCNNPPQQFGGTDCTVESGWTDLGGVGILHHEQKLSSCTNNTTVASSCTACAAGQVFLPGGTCGACSGTYTYPALAATIGSVGASTTIGGPSACTVTINGAVAALGTVTIEAASVVISGTVNGTGGGNLGGNGGAGGAGSAASSPATGATGAAGSVGVGNTGSNGAAGAHGTGGASCNTNPCTGSNGTVGTNGTAGGNASAAGQLGGGGGGGGGGAGGGYGKYKTNCDNSKAYGFTLTPGGGGGGGAGGSGGAAISVIAFSLTGNGTINVLGDSAGGNGGNGAQPTAGTAGAASSVGTSNNGTGSAGLSCTISGTTKTGGSGGNGGDGAAGGAGSVSFTYSGAKGHTITVNRGSGFFTNN